MFIPGFPGITLKEIRASKQPLESLPFPLKQKCLVNSDKCLEKTKPNTPLANHYTLTTSHYFYFARNGIYHGLKHFNIKPGDEVLMPELNSTIEPQVVRTLGAIPVFYKVVTNHNPLITNHFADFTPDWDDVRSKLTTKTKFFHLIHYLGVPNDVDTAQEFCEKHNLIFFEDAAYGFLSSYQGSPSTSSGNKKIPPERSVAQSKDYQSVSPLGSHGHFSILCPRKTIPVPNGGILVINHGAWSMEHGTSEQYNSSQLQATSYKLQASYSSLWDWQYLLRNRPTSVIPDFDPESKNENKKQKDPALSTNHYPLTTAFKHLLKDPFYVFHGSGTFNINHADWGMTTMAYNQLFKFDYPSIIQKNLENYTYVRDFCVNKGWDIFPHEIKPGTVPNAILLRVKNQELRIKNDFVIRDSRFVIQNDHSNNHTQNTADVINSLMLQRGIQLARPWQWNENLTTSRNLTSVDAYSGRGLILPIHYQLTREHLDYYLSLLSSLLP